MKTFLHVLGVGALAVCSVMAMAQSQSGHNAKPIRANHAIQVEPIRVARAILTVGPDGRPKPMRVGPWMKYEKATAGITAQTQLAYDEYEFSDTTATDLTPGDNPNYAGCVSGGGRWYFGNGYFKGYGFNDLKVVPAAAGTESTRSAWAWFMAAAATMDFQYFQFTTENFPQTAGPGTGANDPSAAGRGDYPGVVYSYGPLAPGAGYYFSDLDLSQGTLTHHLPNDGEGGIYTIFGDYNAGTQTLTPLGEPMLWGLVPGNPTPVCSDLQWDDDAPVDLTLTDGSNGTNIELYSYDYTSQQICPPILGAMVCFFYPGSSTETLAPISEQIVLGNPGNGGNLASWAADDNNARRVCKFIVPNLQSPFVVVNLGFTTTKTTPTAITFETKAKQGSLGSMGIRLYVQNKVTNAYINVLPTTALTLAYVIYSGNATGTLTDYVGGGGAMTGRIEIQQTGPVVGFFPCADFEYANMKVTG